MKIENDRSIDDVDRKLLELLRADGRASNRALAEAVGLTEVSVAARIRRLIDADVLAVTAVFDYARAGYRFEASVAVQTAGKAVREVARKLAKLPLVHTVAIVLGPADLSVAARAPTHEELFDLITAQIPAVAGVRRITTELIAETVDLRSGFATFPTDEPELVFPAPVVDLDPLDHEVIRALVHDGRQSNRQIARDLDVAANTVRSRIVRLEEAGLMRIVAQVDPMSLDPTRVFAYLGVEVEGPRARNVARALARLPEIQFSAVAIGDHHVVAAVTTADQASLRDLVVDRLPTIAGVRRTETWQIVEVVKANYHWVRFL
ncbi:MAG: Lrp/AsnC family transcriptional regulator [Candidatus Binatia bacterium]